MQKTNITKKSKSGFVLGKYGDNKIEMSRSLINFYIICSLIGLLLFIGLAVGIYFLTKSKKKESSTEEDLDRINRESENRRVAFNR